MFSAWCTLTGPINDDAGIDDDFTAEEKRGNDPRLVGVKED